MDTAKREALEAAGFRVGGAREFLGLSPEEEALVELKQQARQMALAEPDDAQPPLREAD